MRHDETTPTPEPDTPDTGDEPAPAPEPTDPDDE